MQLARVVGSVVVVVGILRTRLGLGLAAARDAPPAARALGVSIRRAQLVAFVVAAAGCGMAGAISMSTPDRYVDASWMDDCSTMAPSMSAAAVARGKFGQ